MILVLLHSLIGVDALISTPFSENASSLLASMEPLTTAVLPLASTSGEIIEDIAASSSSKLAKNANDFQQQKEFTSPPTSHSINETIIKNVEKGNLSEDSKEISGSGSNSSDMWVRLKHACKISEWQCTNGLCISLSKFCDGSADCTDKSDEPYRCNGRLCFLCVK